MPSLREIACDVTRWARKVWAAWQRRRRGAKVTSSQAASVHRGALSATEQDGARPLARLHDPGHGPASDDITGHLMRRIGELEDDFGSFTSDAPALLEDLRSFQPSMIRQPAAAAQKVLRLLDRGNYSGAEVAELIESDPAIAQALLRHANATWYEKTEALPLESLVAAARRVGTQGVHAAVMSTIMEGGFARPGAGLDNLAKSVWDHMVRVAPLARHIGRGFGADPDAAFTLGLSHDVGKLVLFDRIADLRKRCRREITFPRGFLSAALRNLHEPLGGLAALEWGLSTEFARIIASHHRDTPPSDRQPLSEAIFVAERLDLAKENEQRFDLKEVWRLGALRTDFHSGARHVEQASVAAVVAALRAPAAPEGMARAG